MVFAECFVCVTSFDPQDNPVSSSHFTAGETEAARSWVTCPRLSIEEGAEPKFEPRLSDSGAPRL